MSPRGRRWAAVLAVSVACTATPPEPRDRESPSPEPAQAVVLTVVASLTGPTSAEDGAAVDGMRLAERVINRFGGLRGRLLRLEVIDDRGRAEGERSGLLQALRGEGAAVVVVGSGATVTEARSEIERRGTPVMLVRGDLYSFRELFRQVFQATTPLQWEADAIARYLVLDRRAERVALVVEEGPHAEESVGVLEASFADEGLIETRAHVVSRDEPLGGIGQAVRGADAVVVAAPRPLAARVTAWVGRLDRPPRVVMTAEGLEPEEPEPSPGTGAVGAYTWAGWADPIPRVARFRARFEGRFERRPGGLEQQGYEAVRVLAGGLYASEIRGGEALIRALETMPDLTFSSTPVDLGPDDHLVPDRHLLGLFAVAGPGEEVEAWAPPWAPWRPVMRTFTLLLGERTSILDMDRRVFFPGWGRREPAPFFWQSRYGIVTRADEDPLH